MNCLDNNVVVMDSYWRKLSHRRNANSYTCEMMVDDYCMEQCRRDKGVDKSNDNNLRRLTLAEECQESLNPRTKYWRDSLRKWTSSYEQRTYGAANERTRTTIAEESKSEDEVSHKTGANKQKRQKNKKAVRWSKKS